MIPNAHKQEASLANPCEIPHFKLPYLVQRVGVAFNMFLVIRPNIFQRNTSRCGDQKFRAEHRRKLSHRVQRHSLDVASPMVRLAFIIVLTASQMGT